MAKEKAEEQLADELESLEIPGNQNPWNKKSSRYTNTILAESAGTEFSSQIISSLVRRDQNILEGVNNRQALAIATLEASEYEKLRYKISQPEAVDDTPDLKVVYTRNAESKNYFINPPWKYDDSPLGNFKKQLSREMHTQTVIDSSKSDGNLDGKFLDILYTDNSQDNAKITSQVRQGMVGFPELFSSIGSFAVTDQWVGNDNSIITLEQQVGATSTMEKKQPDSGTIVEQVSKYWSPIYNPCAIPSDDKRVQLGIFSGFGPRKRRAKPKPSWHYGIDIGVSAGYPIVAIADGTIERIGTPSEKDSSKIGYVTVNHTLPSELKDYSVKTRSMHLFLIGEKNGRTLQVGDSIKAGEVLGYMGGEKGWPGAGETDGAHLHFETLVSKRVDGKDTYDTYERPSADGKTQQIFNGTTAKFSPGAADPLLFSYPNFAKFRSNAKQSLKDQLPTKQLVEQVAKDTEKANSQEASTSEIPPASTSEVPPGSPTTF
jgi:murein DD-endopeptidase MepM/ murein hydrolase activator NlpD